MTVTGTSSASGCLPVRKERVFRDRPKFLQIRLVAKRHGFIELFRLALVAQDEHAASGIEVVFLAAEDVRAMASPQALVQRSGERRVAPLKGTSSGSF